MGRAAFPAEEARHEQPVRRLGGRPCASTSPPGGVRATGPHPYRPTTSAARASPRESRREELEPGTGRTTREPPHAHDRTCTGTRRPHPARGRSASAPRTPPEPGSPAAVSAETRPPSSTPASTASSFKGIGQQPLYLYDTTANEVRPAADLWGNDVFAVQELLQEAARRGRAGSLHRAAGGSCGLRDHPSPAEELCRAGGLRR